MSEERQDVLGTYIAATYDHARYADLHRVLSNDEWDDFAKEAGERAFLLVERLINERFTSIEAAREEANDVMEVV